MLVQDLKHVTRKIRGGGQVLLLNTGAAINAESEAMLQALHSRSIGGIKAHLKKLASSGSENFMAQFYVGYGHKSIGDCGTVTLFIEGVSMLVAKAIQDFMLYNGQEASTRYIDFARQRFVDPLMRVESDDILEGWRQFYLEGLGVMKEELRIRHPRKDGEDEVIYGKAINARAFDVMRGFLPAGASTNLAWHGELRHVADHLDRLRHHPLTEMRRVVRALDKALIKVYPSSFKKKDKEKYKKTEDYTKWWMRKQYYYDAPLTGPEIMTAKNNIDIELLKTHKQVLVKRPMQTELPKFVGECGTMQFEYMLDFASFRDNQRHRAVIQRMPLLTANHGFSDWYLSQLPETFREKAENFIRLQLVAVKGLNVPKVVRQYYLPMGMLVSCRKTGDLPALVYLVERRARLDVHPTMRRVAQSIGTFLESEFGKFGLKLYMEMSDDRFHYDRGKQDIVEKASAA